MDISTMKKQLCLLLLGLAISPIASADLTFEAFDGMYAYLGGGGSIVDFQNDMTMGTSTAASTTTITSNNDKNTTVALGAIGLGYGTSINQQFYLGLEAFGEAGSNVEETDTVTFTRTGTGTNLEGQTTSKLNESYGLLLKPGFFIDGQTLVYAVVGPKWGNFKVDTTTTLTETSGLSGNVLGATLNGSSKETKAGIAAGLGIQRAINCNFHIAAEYQYTDYGSLTSPTPTSGTLVTSTGATGTLTNDSSVKVITNQILLKFIYRFF